MRRVAVLAACLASILPADDLPAQPSRDGSLRAFLQTAFREHGSDPDARYALAWADLNADGQPEAVIRMLSRDHCGTGGCVLFIYRARGRSWTRVARTTVTGAPIRVLDTRSHGWRDLSVRVSGGGIRRGYEAQLRFNGRTYPGNPSVPPARRLARRVPGRVLIAADDRGRPLF